MHQHARLFGKEGNVGVEEIGAEPEDDHSGFGQLDGEGIFDAPVIGSVANQNAGLRAVTAAYMLEERENDGKDDALLDAKDDDGSGGDEGQGEFVRFGALNFSQAATVDKNVTRGPTVAAGFVWTSWSRSSTIPHCALSFTF